MSAYVRKTRCGVAKCPYCPWRKVFFGVDRRELGEQAIRETLNHLREASQKKRGAR